MTRNIEVAEFVRDELPGVLGSLALLREVQSADLIARYRRDHAAVDWDDEPHGAFFEPPHHRYIPIGALVERLAVGDREGWTSAELDRFTIDLQPALTRGVGGLNDETHIRQKLVGATLSLAYLSNAAVVSGLILRFYAPLLGSPIDWTLRSRLASFLSEHTDRLLYGVERIAAPVEGGFFDWHGNLNGLDDADRRAILRIANVRPLAHASFPPEWLWLHHNPSWGSCGLRGERKHRRHLEREYAEIGYSIGSSKMLGP